MKINKAKFKLNKKFLIPIVAVLSLILILCISLVASSKNKFSTSEYQSKIDSLNSQNITLHKDIVDLNSQISDLSRQIEILVASNETYQETIQNQRSENQNLKEQINSLNKQLQDLELRLEAYENSEKLEVSFKVKNDLVSVVLVDENSTLLESQLPLNIEYGLGQTLDGWSLDGLTIVDPLTATITNDTTFTAILRNKTLEECSWSEISEISQQGLATEYFSLGEEKTFSLSSGEDVTVVIVGFNHDDLTDGSGKAGITFGMKHLLSNTYAINSGTTNWANSSMRNSTLPSIFNLMTSDLQNAIKKVDKVSATGSSNNLTEVSINAETLWLFSYQELVEDVVTGLDEGMQYEYFKTNSDFMTKSLANGSGNTSGWWLRTLYTMDNTQFNYIDSSSNLLQSSPSAMLGVCMGFCI